MSSDGPGSPYAPHTDEDTAAMLEAIGVSDQDELFDIPEAVQFEGSFEIPQRSEQGVRTEITETLSENDTLTEFLGRGHYDHYQPAILDDLAGRSEFLTSYTQYQPEIAQGFLQALFEYQSMFVELTGLDIVNCSMYDAATALGEAATMADRVRSVDGHRVLVPEEMIDGRRSVLENYVAGADLEVESYPMDDGTVSVEGLTEQLDEESVLVYVENPSVSGAIEEQLDDITEAADDVSALTVLGSDPVALSLLQEPAAVGVDVVIGEAATMGLPVSYGTGLGLFATREDFLRQVPGRLVGASIDKNERRSYTLTLQTREQHIRRERATSNICTNQAWVALRTAIHIAWLGPAGLADLATDCVEWARETAAAVDDINGLEAPVHDRHHFREFVARTERPASAVAADLAESGYAVHTVGDHEIQICVTETNVDAVDGLVTALEEVAA